MRYLLDTHAILWYVDAADELPIKLRDMIDASESAMYTPRMSRSSVRSTPTVASRP